MILMAEVNRARLEEELVRHYTSQREPANPAMMNQLVSAMVAEDARMRRSQQRRMGEVAFVAAHVRFIPAWTWAAQAGLVALMCVLAHAANDASATKAASTPRVPRRPSSSPTMAKMKSLCASGR